MHDKIKLFSQEEITALLLFIFSVFGTWKVGTCKIA
jgi:hypothetical protein